MEMEARIMTNLNGLKEPHNNGVEQTVRGRHALCSWSAFPLWSLSKGRAGDTPALLYQAGLRRCSLLTPAIRTQEINECLLKKEVLLRGSRLDTTYEGKRNAQ